MKKEILSMEELDAIAQSHSRPYLLKFGYESCGPCQAMKPVLEMLSENNPEFDIYEIDTQVNPEIAGHFGIRSVPTMHFCEGREILYSLHGSTPVGKLQYIINNIDDEYFREHGEFYVAPAKKDYTFTIILMTIVLVLILALVFLK